MALFLGLDSDGVDKYNNQADKYKPIETNSTIYKQRTAQKFFAKYRAVDSEENCFTGTNGSWKWQARCCHK